MHEANDLAVEYFRRGDWDNAIRYFRIALQHSPDDPVILDNLDVARQRKAQAEAEAERRRRAQAAAEAERRRRAQAEAEAERRRRAQAEQERERRARAQAARERKAAAERRRLAEAERSRRPITDVPLPKLIPKKTFDQWVHANWSKAPESIRDELRSALRDPQALRAVIRRHQSLIFAWYRRESEESVWNRIVRSYYRFADPNGEGRAKIEAWLGDPMHRAWLGDAAMIATLPLLFEDALGAGAAREAAAESVTRPDGRKLDAVADVYRWRSRSRGASGTHYDFPDFVRSEAPPEIPRGLFAGGNPYKRVNEASNPRGTLWYWQDAVDVWIKRTPQLDKDLNWVLTGKGRL